VTNPTTIYGSTSDLVFTGEHLPSIIYNGCYYSDHMTLLIQKKNQGLLKGNVLYTGRYRTSYSYASVVDIKICSGNIVSLNKSCEFKEA
jgi:hypothetical protein